MKLLAAGANVCAVDKFGWQPLSHAVGNRFGKVEVVRRLIKAGAKTEGSTAFYSPLFLALYEGDAEIVRELVASGADTNKGVQTVREKIKTDFIETPLMMAVARNRLDMVEILLKGGGDVNQVGRGGYTALLRATEANNPKVVKTLLMAGADPIIEHPIDLEHASEWLRGSFDYDDYDNQRKIKALLEPAMKRHMRRRRAAALSVIPPEVPEFIRQEIMALAYPFKEKDFIENLFHDVYALGYVY